MVASIVQKHMKQSLAGERPLSRRQLCDRVHGVHRRDIFHNRPAGFEVDRAVNIQSVTAAALFNRDLDVFGAPTANWT